MLVGSFLSQTLHTLLVSSFYHLHILCVVCVTSFVIVHSKSCMYECMYVVCVAENKTWHMHVVVSPNFILTPTEKPCLY